MTKYKTRNVTYRDLDLNFTRHPVTNDVALVTDETAVKRRIRNLLLTSFHERKFHPEKGSLIPSMIFEPMTGTASAQMMESIQNVLNNWEPGIDLKSVNVIPDFEKASFTIRIEFSIKAIPSSHTSLDFSLSLNSNKRYDNE